jgi:hypothetical protein
VFFSIQVKMSTQRHIKVIVSDVQKAEQPCRFDYQYKAGTIDQKVIGVNAIKFGLFRSGVPTHLLESKPGYVSVEMINKRGILICVSVDALPLES